MSNTDSTINNRLFGAGLFILRFESVIHISENCSIVNMSRNVNKIYKNSAPCKWYNIIKQYYYPKERYEKR